MVPSWPIRILSLRFAAYRMTIVVVTRVVHDRFDDPFALNNQTGLALRV